MVVTFLFSRLEVDISQLINVNFILSAINFVLMLCRNDHFIGLSKLICIIPHRLLSFVFLNHV